MGSEFIVTNFCLFPLQAASRGPKALRCSPLCSPRWIEKSLLPPLRGRLQVTPRGTHGFDPTTLKRQASLLVSPP